MQSAVTLLPVEISSRRAGLHRHYDNSLNNRFSGTSSSLKAAVGGDSTAKLRSRLKGLVFITTTTTLSTTLLASRLQSAVTLLPVEISSQRAGLHRHYNNSFNNCFSSTSMSLKAAVGGDSTAKSRSRLQFPFDRIYCFSKRETTLSVSALVHQVRCKSFMSYFIVLTRIPSIPSYRS